MKTVESLLQRALATIERHGMLAPGQRVAVAVSGGADSVCLLHLLRELAPAWSLQLSVLHLDHGLRGQESRADAEFVGRLAASLGLPATIRAVDVGAEPGNLEQSARLIRLAFFREIMGTGAADRVALGHTRNDQAETVLYRFLRGSGTAGLAGIYPVTEPGIVRPLLDCDRGDIEQYLRDRGIAWREDSSNTDPRFDRNRIRHQLLPAIGRDWNPAIATTLAQTADWAQAEEAWWTAEIDRLSAGCLRETAGTSETEAAVLARIDSLQAAPLAARRRLVRRAIERVKGDLRGIDFGHVEAVLAMAASPKGHGRAHLPGLDVLRSFNWLRFARPAPLAAAYRMAVAVPGALEPAGTGVSLSLELIEKEETSDPSDSVYNGGMGCLDWGRLSGFLECRNWKPGDRYQPIGFRSVEKIKTLFQQARIPLWERRNWPILMDGASIVWVRRFGPAAPFAAGPDSTTILRVREVAIEAAS